MPRSKWAYLLYGITGWGVFRDEAEDYEKRLIARRRRPSWADED